MYDDDVVRLDLPSFPTRRSSDLENLPVELWSMSVPGAPRRTVRTIAAHIHNTRCMWIKMIGASHGVAVPRNVNARTDRKSTRLNSSHLVISYAVFCLKKKNYK